MTVIQIELSSWMMLGKFTCYDVSADIPGAAFGRTCSTLEDVAMHVLYNVAVSKVPLPAYEILLDAGARPQKANSNGTFCTYTQMPEDKVKDSLASLLQDSSLMYNARRLAKYCGNSN